MNGWRSDLENAPFKFRGRRSDGREHICVVNPIGKQICASLNDDKPGQDAGYWYPCDEIVEWKPLGGKP